jgi:hypothetical protein
VDRNAIPQLAIARVTSSGDALSPGVRIGRAGIRTRSALALVVGAAEGGTRRAVAATLIDLLTRHGDLGHAREVLIPILRDPPSTLPLTVATAQLLLSPTRAAALAHGAVRNYSITPTAIDQARHARFA